jgi:hypothetical protein
MRPILGRSTTLDDGYAGSFFWQSLAGRVKMKLDNESLFHQAALSYIYLGVMHDRELIESQG